MDHSSQNEETATIDYSNFLQAKPSKQNIASTYLETTIFQILKNHSDVFIFNDFEIYDYESGDRAIVQQNGILIGSGGHGEVYYTYNPQTNEQTALKVQNNCSFNDVIQYAEEFKIQKLIANIFPDCIIKIQGKVFIAQNYVDSYKMHAYLDLGMGNLKEYQDKIKEFTETEIDDIYYCILDSIINIHSLKIAHRDIKLGNIIKTKDNGWVLADFGCSTQYKTPYGEYPIVGTIQYQEKSIRLAYQQSKRKYKMNLFKNDIYAFQLVMLQIIYPQKSILDLHTILDEKKIIHPKINQLYNKDYYTIKKDFSYIKFNRKKLTTKYNFSVINLDGAKTNIQNDPFIYFVFTYLSSFKQLRVFQTIFRKIAFQEYQKKEINSSITQKLQNLHFYYFQYFTVQEIYDSIKFEELSKLSYDLYFDIFEKRGSKLLQLMLCQRYQEILGDQNSSLRFQEAELLYIMGFWDEAKQIVNSIDYPQELESDEQILKYCCLKARLNNQWAENHEDIIHYVRNYKDCYQVLFEWKFLMIDSIWIDRAKKQLNQIYKKFYYPKRNSVKQNTNSQPTQETIEIININKYLEKPSFDQDNPKFLKYLSQLKKPLSQVQLMKEYLEYDNYSIFYYCWLYLEGTDIVGEKYRYNLEEFINFIEENLEGYYFNWVIFDIYSEYLTLKNEFKKAEVYNQKALDIVKNDCIYHQVVLYHHLLRLRIKQTNSVCESTLKLIINFIQQLPSPNLRFYFLNLIEEEVNKSQMKIKQQLPWFYVSLDQETRKNIELQTKYQQNRHQFMKEYNFNKLKQNMEDLLPIFIEMCQDEVILDFHNLIGVAQETYQEIFLILNLIFRLLQYKIVYQQLGFLQQAFPLDQKEEEQLYIIHVLQKKKEKIKELKAILKFYYYYQSQL